jgi:LysM repeat protein
MKNFIVILFLVPVFALAQQSHTVQPKETLYSLARKYNIHPRELAAYNNMPVTTSLAVGQVIKIPAKTTMAPLTTPPPAKAEPVEKKEIVEKKEPAEKKEVIVKNTVPAKKEVSKAIYHKVGKKETLYHISKLYDNVSIEDLKKWNKLTGDALSEGTNLIVGYQKESAAKNTETIKEKKLDEIKPVVKETPKQVEPEKKETVKIVKTEPAKNEEENTITGKNFHGGVFKTLYDQQVSGKNVTEQKGPAGIFKSTSGWEDGKYYCLTNTAPPGTIVKITNPVNQRSVYAKVLDLIPDLKQNAGMIIRVSNAAASELGVNADNFESTLNF